MNVGGTIDAYPLGWQADGKGARFLGAWLRLSVHNIHGLPPDDWYLTCCALGLDTVRLQAKTLTEAKVESVRLAWRMSTNYRVDLVVARRFAEGDRIAEDGHASATSAPEVGR